METELHRLLRSRRVATAHKIRMQHTVEILRVYNVTVREKRRVGQARALQSPRRSAGGASKKHKG